MRFVDDNGKVFGKINIVDFFVIVLAIACVIAVAVKGIFGGEKELEEVDRFLTYEVRVEHLRDTSTELIKRNTKDLTDAESGMELGDVEKIEESKARVLIQRDDGNYQFVEYSDRYDLILTLETDGSETKNAYITKSGRRLTVGDTIGIHNGTSEFFGEIIAVKSEEPREDDEKKDK